MQIALALRRVRSTLAARTFIHWINAATLALDREEIDARLAICGFGPGSCDAVEKGEARVFVNLSPL